MHVLAHAQGRAAEIDWIDAAVIAAPAVAINAHERSKFGRLADAGFSGPSKLAGVT
jgi:hypothetical protein